MRKVTLGKHKLVIFESIEELPISRYHKFNKFILVDTHIGSTMAEFDTHLERITQFIKMGDPKSAETEILNLRQNVYLIQEEISPRLLSFASLVYSIDGEEVKDESDESFREVCRKLSDLSNKDIEELNKEIKKKLETELQTYFPNLFDDSSVKDYYDKLRKRTLLVLKLLMEEPTEELKQEIQNISSELILYSKPQIFTGEKSVEVQRDKQFENTCLSLSQALGLDSKKFSVLEYYNALFYLQEQNKSRKTKNRK